MARKLEVQIVGDASSYERSLKRAARDTTKFNREIGKMTRGAAAGSGIFRGLGRSLAFASGGFLGFASATALLKTTIDAGTEAAATQRQLAAQFKASGQNLDLYSQAIDDASNRLSALAGFENDELKRAFTTAFRGSQNVSVSLKIQAIAADVARGRHIELAQATLALTKAYGGQSTALRRLGVQVPKNLTGLEALEFVSRRFAGQAQAGTTAQQRLGAALHNAAEIIGTALLPTFTTLTDSLTTWLSKSENQKKLQEDVTAVTKLAADAFGLLAGAINKTADAYSFLDKHLPGGTGWSLMDFVRRLPGGDKSLLEILGLRGGGGGITGMRDTADRVPGRAPQGPGAFQPLPTGPLAKAPGQLGFRARMAKLDIAFAKAELTRTRRDDRAVLAQQAALVRERISLAKTLGERRDLYQQLANLAGQIQQIDQDARQREQDARKKEIDARKKAAEDAKRHAEKIKTLQLQAAARRTTAQFRQLGFGPGGADLIPSGRELLKRLGKIKDQVKGTILDTQENRKLLARIRETLVGGLGKLAPEVRQKIQELLDALQPDETQKRKAAKNLEQWIQIGRGPRLPLNFFETDAGTRMARRMGISTAAPQAGIRVDRMEVHLHGVQDVGKLENELHKRAKARAHPRRGP